LSRSHVRSTSGAIDSFRQHHAIAQRSPGDSRPRLKWPPWNRNAGAFLATAAFVSPSPPRADMPMARRLRCERKPAWSETLRVAALQAGVNVSRARAGIATAAGPWTKANPRLAVARPRRPHERGRAIRRLLPRNIDVHRLIVRHDYLRYDLLLRAVRPSLGDTLPDRGDRLLTFADRLRVRRHRCVRTGGQGSGSHDEKWILVSIGGCYVRGACAPASNDSHHSNLS
jgi:hypothetical protein